AGMRTVSVLVRVLTPSPPHSGHGSSIRTPWPRQSRHGSVNANAPWLRLTRPAPPHVGHGRRRVPGRAPLPPHVPQVAGLDSRNGNVAPRTASTKSMRTSVSTSAPRCPRMVDVAVPPRRPNRLPSMSPRPPKPPPAVWPNRSLKSKPPLPPPGKLKPPAPPEPNSLRVSSYSLRFSG